MCHCFPQRYAYRWLLTDFGFSTNVESGRLGFSDAKRGTPGYRAPELAVVKYDENGKEKSAEYTKSADIWAVGCIIMQLAITKKSNAFTDGGDWAVVNFANGGGSLPQIVETDNPSLLRQSFCPEKGCMRPFWKQLNLIIHKCLSLNPEDRITAMDLKSWFEKMKTCLIMDASEEEKGEWLHALSKNPVKSAAT